VLLSLQGLFASEDNFSASATLALIPLVEILSKVAHRAWLYAYDTKPKERNESSFGARIKTTIGTDLLEVYTVFSTWICKCSNEKGCPGLWVKTWLEDPLHSFFGVDNAMDKLTWNNVPTMICMIACLCMKESTHEEFVKKIENVVNASNTAAWNLRVNEPFTAKTHPALLSCSSRMLKGNTIQKGVLNKQESGLFKDPRGTICPDKEHINTSDFRVRFSFPSLYYSEEFKKYLANMKELLPHLKDSTDDPNIEMNLLETITIILSNKIPGVDNLKEWPFNEFPFESNVLSVDWYEHLNEYLICVDRKFVVTKLLTLSTSRSAGTNPKTGLERKESDALRFVAEFLGFCRQVTDPKTLPETATTPTAAEVAPGASLNALGADNTAAAEQLEPAAKDDSVAVKSK
jgi:hypothetical protein